MRKIWMGALAGVLAAVVAWPITLPFLPPDPEDAGPSISISTSGGFSPGGPSLPNPSATSSFDLSSREPSREQIASNYCLGTFFGWARNLLFGALAAWFILYVYTRGRSRRDRVRAMLIGAVLGGLLVTLGHAFKDWVSISLQASQGQFGPHLLLLIAMQCLMEPMGLCIAIACAMGLSRGILGRLPLAIAMATVAGFAVLQVASIFIAIALIPMLASSNGRPNMWALSAPAFLAEHIAIGAAVGACLALAETILRRAWLERQLGRGEGYTWILDSPIARIGYGEGVEVRVPHELGIDPNHAQIQRYEEYFAVQDLGGGVLLNGMPVYSAWLSDGDVIDLGPCRLIFRLKRAQARRSVDVPPPAERVGVGTGYASTPFPDAGGTGGFLSTPLGTAAPVTAPLQVLASPSTPEPASLPDWALIDEFGNRHRLTEDVTTVGRDATCGVGLTWEGTVSRRHAEIHLSVSGPSVCDTGSSNGTKVNGKTVGPDLVPLGDGDSVEFGRARLTVRRG